MASSATPGFVCHGRYQIPADVWDIMLKEFNGTVEGSDIQIGSDLSGSTICDFSSDGEFRALDPNLSRLAEIRKGVKAIGAVALKHDNAIELWIIKSSAKSGLGQKRHNEGFSDITKINKFADEFKAGGTTPLADTLEEALDTYVAKVTKNPGADALTLVCFLDGVDDSMSDAVARSQTVDLAPLKDLIMKAASQVKAITGCADVREKLGVQFCLVTGNQKVIQAYNGFDNATMYQDPDTGDQFECDIFDCTTLKQVMEMGGWESPLTHMKLIGGARNETLDNILMYLKEHALDYEPASSNVPPSYEDCMADVTEKRNTKAAKAAKA